eukprot:gene471-biopygen827
MLKAQEWRNYHFSCCNFENVVPMEEDPIEDANLPESQDNNPESRVTYEIVESASQRGKQQLVDSEGYTYVKKRNWRSGKISWRCSVRNKTVYCGATVLQDDESFSRGVQIHCHPGKPGVSLTKKIVAEVKKTAVSNVFQSAGNIVEDIFVRDEEHILKQPRCSQAKMTNLQQCGKHAEKSFLMPTSKVAAFTGRKQFGEKFSRLVFNQCTRIILQSMLLSERSLHCLFCQLNTLQKHLPFWKAEQQIYFYLCLIMSKTPGLSQQCGNHLRGLFSSNQYEQTMMLRDGTEGSIIKRVEVKYSFTYWYHCFTVKQN